MKKALLILICICLLLTACGHPVSPTGTELGSVETEPAQTDAPAPETTEPPPETTEPEPPIRFDGSTTAGGIRVHTDPSAYRPYEAPKAKYTRLHDGPLDFFVPSQDYGTIYPYVAARLIQGSAWWGWEAGQRLGFIDETGCILTDGIYQNIYPLTAYDPYAENSVQLPFWVCYRLTDVEMKTVYYGDDSYDALEGKNAYTLISQDGSFAMPEEYTRVRGLENGFVCYRDEEETDFTVYDLEGKPRFDSEKLRSIGIPELVDMVWREDLYLAGFFSSQKARENGENRFYWFLDANGDPVLGPYQYANAFSEGLACVSVDGENFGYIDHSGDWIIGPFNGGRLESFHDGRAFQTLDDGRSILLDKSGNYILEFTGGGWISTAACGYTFEPYSYGERQFFDRDGALLTSGYWSFYCVDETTFLDNGRLFNLSGAEVRRDEISWVECVTVLVDGTLFSGYLGENREEDLHWLVSRDLQTERCIKYDRLPPADRYLDPYYAENDRVTGETWYFLWDGRVWTGATDSGKSVVFPDWVAHLMPCNGMFETETADASCWFDAEGGILFRLPLDAED